MSEPRVSQYTITETDIKRFAQAIGETDPVHFDPVFASQTFHGGIVAPPLFCQSLTYQDAPPEALPPDGSPLELAVDIPAQRLVGGGSDYTIHRLVRPGDVITATSRTRDIYTKEGKSGRLYMIEVETRFTDQQGSPVATEVATYIKRI